MREQLKPYLLALSCVLGVATGIAAKRPTFTNIEPPDAIFTSCRDINSSGEIVGRYLSAENRSHGFLRSEDGDYVTIDFPGSVSGISTGINRQGDIVGYYRNSDDPATTQHGYLRAADGRFTSFDFPGSTFTGAFGINTRGDIVGIYCNDFVQCLDPSPSARNVHGFLRSGDEFTSIDFPGATQTRPWKINARGQIVGGYLDADGHPHVFVRSAWDEFRSIDLPGNPFVGINEGGINNRGDIVGGYKDANGDLHGFQLSRRGRFRTIDVPGGYQPVAIAINSRGDVVGAYCVDSACNDTDGFLMSREERDEEDDID